MDNNSMNYNNMQGMNGYMPSNNVPPAQPMNNVPPVQPVNNVPPVQPMNNVPPVQPMNNVPPVQPMNNVPPVQPVNNVPPVQPMNNVPPVQPMNNMSIDNVAGVQSDVFGNQVNEQLAAQSGIQVNPLLRKADVQEQPKYGAATNTENTLDDKAKGNLLFIAIVGIILIGFVFALPYISNILGS